jgi:Flp pilus assembly protein TadG
VELALILPFLAMIVFGTIDLGRIAQLQNRLAGASREAVAVVQMRPTNVDHACAGGLNAVDRAADEDGRLASVSGYGVTVSRKDPSTGVLTPYTGCGTASGGLAIMPGDKVVVTVKADLTLVTPLVAALVGSPMHVSRSSAVVVQG